MNNKLPFRDLNVGDIFYINRGKFGVDKMRKINPVNYSDDHKFSNILFFNAEYVESGKLAVVPEGTEKQPYFVMVELEENVENNLDEKCGDYTLADVD